MNKRSKANDKSPAEQKKDSRTAEPLLLQVNAVSLSPYVIDLRAAEPPVVMRINDLYISNDDLIEQLEPEEKTSMVKPNWPLLMKLPAHLELWDEIRLGASRAYSLLKIPDEEKKMLMPLRRPSWQRGIASFVALSFFFVAPIQAMKQWEQWQQTKKETAAEGLRAVDELTLAVKALQAERFDAAAGVFEQARGSFTQAEEMLASLSDTWRTLIKALPPTRATFNATSDLLSAGDNLSAAAAIFSTTMNEMRTMSSDSILNKLNVFFDALPLIEPRLDAAVAALDALDTAAIPPTWQEKIQELRLTLPSLLSFTREALTFSETIKTLLGNEQTMRYLVIFQNNMELRPTGGFIGSFAEVTIRDGQIEDVRVPAGGSYDLQGTLTEFVKSPEPLRLLRARWEFQDGNWFPDFPTSAAKLLWFYDHAGGPTTDGVLAINATAVAELLSIIGAVDMPAYGRTIDSENFLFETQKIVEQEYNDPTAPKQFIADLTPRLLERLQSLDTPTLFKVLSYVKETFEEREAQIMWRDPSLMRLADELGWSGRIAQTDGDFLMIVQSNLGGGKTDLVVAEDVTLDVQIRPDGSIENTVTVTRKHTGLTGAPFTGVNNVSYLRIYVPRGSQLITAQGDFAPPSDELFEKDDPTLQEDRDLFLISSQSQIEPRSGTIIGEEFGKTVFGNWMQTAPGRGSSVSFTYQPPFTISSLKEKTFLERLRLATGLAKTDRYSLFVQKQSGALTRKTRLFVHLPENLRTIWASDDAFLDQEGLAFPSTTDFPVSLLLKKR